MADREDRPSQLRADRPGLKKLLGDQEAEIMEQVWAIGGPVLARQVHERIPSGPKLAYSSVVCTMGRLVNKGLLSVLDDTTKPYLYKPTVSREVFIDRTVAHLLAALRADFPLAVSRFLQPEDDRPSDAIVQAVFETEE